MNVNQIDKIIRWRNDIYSDSGFPDGIPVSSQAVKVFFLLITPLRSRLF